MKLKSRVVVAAIILLACVTAVLIPRPPSASPVSVSLLAYTNELAGSGAAVSATQRSKAIFELTNHTASWIRYDMAIDGDGFEQGPRFPETSTGRMFGLLAAHATQRRVVTTTGGSNGWRFVVVTSVSGARSWQRITRGLLRRVGVEADFLGADHKYPPFTNVWTSS